MNRQRKSKSSAQLEFETGLGISFAEVEKKFSGKESEDTVDSPNVKDDFFTTPSHWSYFRTYEDRSQSIYNVEKLTTSSKNI